MRGEDVAQEDEEDVGLALPPVPTGRLSPPRRQGMLLPLSSMPLRDPYAQSKPRSRSEDLSDPDRKDSEEGPMVFKDKASESKTEFQSLSAFRRFAEPSAEPKANGRSRDHHHHKINKVKAPPPGYKAVVNKKGEVSYIPSSLA